MLKIGNWLIIEERDSADLRLHKTSIVSVWKHFLESRGRSFLHNEPDCPLCQDYGPPRLRYQAKVIIKGESLNWEFGEEAYQAIQEVDDLEGWVRIVVTRLGRGRRTTYQVSVAGKWRDALTPDNTGVRDRLRRE